MFLKNVKSIEYRSLLQEKNINDSMFIVELAVSDIITNITLENSDIMLISH
jgi:hypothetical protein